MMKKVVIFLIALVLVMYTLDGAFRAPQMARHMGYGIHMVEKNLFSGRMLLRMKDDIGLTDEQVSKIEKMQQAHRESMIKRDADLEILQSKFDTYLKEKQIDRARVDKLIREIATARTEMQLEIINYLLDLRKLLTAEQLVKAEELKEKMRSERWGAGKGWRDGCPRDKIRDRVKDRVKDRLKDRIRDDRFE
ncbi:MAG: periplasmic heavy metal sensor [Candidatus Aminicenantes bacterium]|nr:periplasmic heavy metal sensor [Candidatus Aminicenantes bacterium]